nr:MAG TPA: hypothetical protein [Caudoviricetes sp.]
MSPTLNFVIKQTLLSVSKVIDLPIFIFSKV